MPTPLWDRLCTLEQLWLAWQKVRANHGGAGGDGVRIADFEKSAGGRIERLVAALQSGHYLPGPIRHVAIPKKSGGERRLAIPCIIDRVVQTGAAMVAAPVLEPTFERSSFAYRPGRGVTHAVQAVLRYRRQGYRWAAEGDVRQCFDEIPHEQLLGKLETALGDARLVDLVALWLATYAPHGAGIPQGSPISPLLCNLHLDAVDEAIDGSGLRLVRYADDFVILAKTKKRAQDALEDMASVLRVHGLELHPDKSRIVDSEQALRFLGHVFIRSMAFREVTAEDDPPAPPDAPPEEVLAQWEQDVVREWAEADAPEEPRPSRLRTMHLVEPHALLGVRNASFVAYGPELIGADGVPRRDGRLIEHATRIDRIEIGPGAQADWAALQLAAAQGVPVAMVDGYGSTNGWLSGPGDLRARRIAQQARWLAQPANCERLAMAIVRGRVRNQRLMLKRLNKSRGNAEIARTAETIKRMARALPETAASDVANGYEGSIGAHYWPAYAKCIAPGFGFDREAWRRQRRPPPDPINACLGYLSALLERDIRVAIERAGLHPGMGALHVARDGADALVYDLMEGFRCAVPEAILTTMIGRRNLVSNMFVTRVEIDPQGNETRICRMELAARRGLIQAHESWLARPIKSKRLGRKVLWRALFEEEARSLADLFAGEADSFTPYEIDF